jgi:hypothetical protein
MGFYLKAAYEDEVGKVLSFDKDDRCWMWRMVILEG